MNSFSHFFWFASVLLAPLWSAAAEKRMLILGDSLTKGYGLEQAFAFPSILQQKIAESGLPEWEVLNGGVSGDTTAGGLRRLPWLLKKEVDLLVVALGGNDGLRGIDPAETERNLQAMIQAARARYPEIEIVIAGMQMPENFGKDYIEQFQAVFPRVAQANNLTLIPFLLEGVGGIAELNQPDQIHPNKEGQKIVAETVWEVIRPILEYSSAPSSSELGQ